MRIIVKLAVCACAAAVFLGAHTLQAAPITVPNHSFETGAVMNHGNYGDMVSPWVGGWIDSTPGGYSLDIPAQDGDFVASGSFYQALTDTFVEGVTYTLSGYYTPRDPGWFDGPLGFYRPDLTPAPAGTGQLLPGYHGESGLNTPAHGQWHLVTTNYTATASDDGNPIGIFVGGAYWDNFSLEDNSAVPEPSSIVLAGLGLLGLGWFGFRRRK